MDKGDAAIAGLAIFSLVLGAALTIVLEFARGQMERKQRKQDRRDDFQHKTALDLQEAVYSHVQNLAAIMHFQRMGYLGSNRWRSKLLPDDLNDADYEGRLHIAMLAVRIQDAEIRRLVGEYTEVAGRTVTAMSMEAAEEANNQATTVRKQLNDRIGELLRGL